MSVDFYSCKCCGDSVYEEFIASCIKCNNRLCTNCLINKDGKTSRYYYQYGYIFDPNNEELIKELVNEGFELKDNNGDDYYKEGDLIDDSAIIPKHCPYCSGSSPDRERVLKHLLDKYNLDINTVWKEIR